MVNDAYIEHNKTKRQAWLLVPILFVIILLIALFGDRDNDKLLQPKLLESSPAGLLLELPNVSTTKAGDWKTQWKPSSDIARQQVLQSLSEYAADYKQLRTQLEVWAEPGSTSRDQLVQRIGSALERYDLGEVKQEANPAVILPAKGILLICAAADKELALRMLAALTPYISGEVSIRFETNLAAQTMRLYLFGTPYFNDQGQAKFDRVDI
ncbi:hypothetical protein OLEAN_C09910 [Oleispira antarctica RB-8]|mgnify:FL=1|uniref:Uncharacterized protein n=1 Tax=Oleispira antarctica RB-8 TaxID=698738 RepID=R4YKW0_OLEAN|nr:hypothetical protein OLEAN_C09910 [Oleispira antarctica RB-8]